MITALKHLSANLETVLTQRVFCIQDDRAAEPHGYSDGNTAGMQLAGSPPAAWCWACTCCTNDTAASQNKMMRTSYFLLCCMAAQGRHEAQSYTLRGLELCLLGEIDPCGGSVPLQSDFFSCAFLSLLLWL